MSPSGRRQRPSVAAAQLGKQRSLSSVPAEVSPQLGEALPRHRLRPKLRLEHIAEVVDLADPGAGTASGMERLWTTVPKDMPATLAITSGNAVAAELAAQEEAHHVTAMQVTCAHTRLRVLRCA